MNLNELLNASLTEGPYQSEAADILHDLNMGKRAPTIRIDDPAIIVDGVSIPLGVADVERLQAGLWAIWMETQLEKKG